MSFPCRRLGLSLRLILAVSSLSLARPAAGGGACFFVSLPLWTSYYSNAELTDQVGMCEAAHCNESCWGQITEYFILAPQSIDCLPEGCEDPFDFKSAGELDWLSADPVSRSIAVPKSGGR